MRLSTCILIFLLLAFHLNTSAQDEGTLTRKARVTKGKSFYFFGGPSIPFGKMKGDYSGGLNLEAGYLLRLNRILSIGPSLSFSKFNYDESISDSKGDPGAEGNNYFIDFYQVKVVYMEGGDLKLFSMGFNFKFDFVPDAADRKFRAYGIAKPFLLLSSRSEVSASVQDWYMDNLGDGPSNWYYGGGPDERIDSDSPGYSRWGAETEFSGGLNLGAGAEYKMSAALSILLQSVVQMTLPITYTNTSEFDPTLAGYNHPDYPFVKKGFTALNISIGVAYRF